MADELNSDLSRLDLRVTFPEDLRDFPTVSVLIDGVELSAGAFAGFPADEMLGGPIPVPDESGAWVDPPEHPSSPLIPSTDGARIAVCQCSCGIAGCGVMAPIIAVENDVVTWTDFRDYTGVFDRPDDSSDGAEGRSLEMPQIRFDASQYLAEVSRAVADRSWESQSRVTARVLRAMLAEHSESLAAAGLRLGWVSSVAWRDPAGQFLIELRDSRQAQYLVSLTAKYGTPTSRARSIVDRLLAVPVDDWHRRFPDGR